MSSPAAFTPDQPRRRATGGRMVLTPGASKPFKAVLTYEDGHTAESQFQTCREGEAFLRTHNAMIPRLPEPSRRAPCVEQDWQSE